MPIIQTWWDAILNSVADTLSAILGFALPLIGAFVILYIGWIVGRLLERILIAAGQGMKANDETLARSAFGQLLASLGITFRIGSIFSFAAWIGKWFLYVSFFMAAMTVLAFTAVNTFIGSATAFFPKALVGALFIFIGLVLARFLRSLLETLLNGFRMPGGDIAGPVAYWAVMVFAFLAALNHFGVPFNALLWDRVFDMLVIAGGIAIGLGFSGRFAELFDRLRKGL